MAEALSTSVLSRHITSYLRGVAIIAVMVNHYAILYFHVPYTYAYSLMSFFFILGGAGIYLSMERDIGDAGLSRGLAIYLYKRLSRIFPLYWFAYTVYVIELFACGWFVGDFSVLDLMGALVGVPINPRGIYWFVTAILQCYVFAPLLYLIVKRQGAIPALGTALMMLAGSLLVTVFLSDLTGNAALRDMLQYKELFLGNVILFFLGMLIPPMLSLARKSSGVSVIWIAAAFGFLFLTYATDTPDLLFPWSGLYLAPLLFMTAFVFCLSITAAAPRLPLGGLFRLHGENSFPLYLLHLPLFILLFETGVIREYSYVSVAWTLLIYPLFLVACVSVESLSDHARRGAGTWLFEPGLISSRPTS